MSLAYWTLALCLAQAETEPPPEPEAESTPAAPAKEEGAKVPDLVEQGPDKALVGRAAASPEVFAKGLEAFYSDDWTEAAARMFDYVDTNDESVENRAWAKYFLGISLEQLGYTHAAAEHLFDVIDQATAPELLPDALLAVERLMAGPHDETLLDERLIVETDFGYLPPSVAGFVRYHQGLADLRADRNRWAERLLLSLPPDSVYDAKAEYALGVERLKRDRVDEAVKWLRSALAHPAADRTTRNDARLALARILYERRRYDAAEAMYLRVEVPPLTAAEGRVLLERAWTAYWMGDDRQAMGRIHALEAPSYRDLHAPEKMLLRALIYQRSCHYIPAKREVRRFRFAYGPTLDNIRRRIDLREDATLRRAALSESPQLRRLVEFRRVLEAEARRIDDGGSSWREVGLDESLREIYRLAAARADLELDAELAEQTRARAEELVAFEEQMYLLDYEVGLAIYARLSEEDARRGTRERIEIPPDGPEAFYPFVGEFWNDELASYDFLIESRCFDEGGTP